MNLFHFAGQGEILKYLVEIGADIEAREGDGRTPLFLAIEHGDRYGNLNPKRGESCSNQFWN